MKFIFFIVLGFLSLQTPPLYSDTSKPVKFRLLSSVQGTGQEKNILLGLILDHEPGWKTYGPSSHPTAYPPKIFWKDSHNIATVETLWPHGISSSDTKNIEEEPPLFFYQDQVIIPLKIHLLKPGEPIFLNLQVDMLACQTLCVPLQENLSLTLPAGLATPTPDAPLLEQVYKNLQSTRELSLGYLLLLSLLGGFILNLMPCVLPVLSLKLLKLIPGPSSSRGSPQKGFLWTFMGILTSFLTMGGLAAFLKTLGLTLGWGTHFQNPFFLGAMGLIMILFSLNLLGIYEISLPQWIGNLETKNQKAANSFFMGDFLAGFMATLLATPCSAPFLGTALGYGLTRGSFQIILIFLFLGLGFGAPYLAGALLPLSWIKLPRPGPWMIKARRLLGVGMLLSALWFLLGIAPHMGLPSVFQWGNSFFSSQEDPPELKWHPFDPHQIPLWVDKGYTVFLDVTADWCLTCHYNKRQVLKTPLVQEKLKAPHVILMKADWTQKNQFIHDFIERYHRSGVPLNIIFGPHQKNGIVLPELLTQNTVLKAFAQAEGPR